MNGDDLLWAMATLGFEDYIEPLKIYLHKCREVRAYSFGCLGELSKLVPCLGDFNICDPAPSPFDWMEF
jgi:hypothetical protein